VTFAGLAEVLEAAAAKARELDAAERAELRSWIDQASSPLGPRRHRAAVRRRTAAGEPGAAQVGRRALLSVEALQEELATLSKSPRASKAQSAAPGTVARLRQRLALVGVDVVRSRS
jgi:hypothetical protein